MRKQASSGLVLSVGPHCLALCVCVPIHIVRRSLFVDWQRGSLFTVRARDALAKRSRGGRCRRFWEWGSFSRRSAYRSISRSCFLSPLLLLHLSFSFPSCQSLSLSRPTCIIRNAGKGPAVQPRDQVAGGGDERSGEAVVEEVGGDRGGGRGGWMAGGEGSGLGWIDLRREGSQSVGTDFFSFLPLSHMHFSYFSFFLTASLIVLTFTVFFDAGTGPPV